ncbi:MAG: transporter, partial [Alloprevotella sp.]|nr:transporter [Alloprevotella sp.]
MLANHLRMSLAAFLKHWTLPVSMGTGTVAYLLFANLPGLSGVAEVFGSFFDAIYPVFMFAVLFVTFCKADFRRLRPAVWHWQVSLVQLVLLLLQVGIVLFLGLRGCPLVLAEGLLVCTIAPTATAAAVVTSKLGGDLEGMTAYTFASNLLTALYVPLLFPLLPGTAAGAFLPSFVHILYKVCSVLVLPMLLAWFVKYTLPYLHRRIVSVRDLSFYLWGVSLAIVTGTTVKHIAHSEASVPFLVLVAAGALLICLLQFALGRLLGHRSGAVLEAGQGLGQKNTAFA